VVNWLPSYTIMEILRRLKYTIMEPNLQTIPNNWLCKRAAYFYKIDRSNFRERIEQYLPEVLESIVLKELGDTGEEMTEEEEERKKYVSIGDILPTGRMTAEEDEGEDDLMTCLNKKMGKVHLDEEN
jgi:hypothetical protein